MIDAIASYYTRDNANVHRGVHDLSARATDAYEAARERVRTFLNAGSIREIIFTRTPPRRSTSSPAPSPGRGSTPGDEVLITAMEHHSNIVPWQLVCEATGARLTVAPINDRGELILEEFDRLLTAADEDRVGHPRVERARHDQPGAGDRPARARQGRPGAHRRAQAAPHMRVDVQALDCDFLVSSGHKLYGPTGIGVLYGKEALLEAMPPFRAAAT